MRTFLHQTIRDQISFSTPVTCGRDMMAFPECSSLRREPRDYEGLFKVEIESILDQSWTPLLALVLGSDIGLAAEERDLRRRRMYSEYMIA